MYSNISRSICAREKARRVYLLYSLIYVQIFLFFIARLIIFIYVYNRIEKSLRNICLLHLLNFRLPPLLLCDSFSLFLTASLSSLSLPFLLSPLPHFSFLLQFSSSPFFLYHYFHHIFLIFTLFDYSQFFHMCFCLFF